MYTHGKVDIAHNGESARCRECNKSLIKKAWVNPDLWKATLQAFAKKHRDCTKKEK